MKNTTMIVNTEDRVPITDADITDIQISPCLNCFGPYDPVRPVMFSRLTKGKLLWWHQDRCAKGLK